MAVTVVATPGAASANSFVTVEEFTDYVATRLNVGSAATAIGDDPAKAVIEATRDITILDYEGQKVTLEQALAWPRQFAINPDAPEIIGVRDIAFLYFATDVIPQRVKDATCELAIEFLRAGTTDIAAADSKAGVIEETVDVITTRWSDGYSRPEGLARFPRLRNLLAPLLCDSNSGGLDLVRV